MDGGEGWRGRGSWTCSTEKWRDCFLMEWESGWAKHKMTCRRIDWDVQMDYETVREEEEWKKMRKASERTIINKKELLTLSPHWRDGKWPCDPCELLWQRLTYPWSTVQFILKVPSNPDQFLIINLLHAFLGFYGMGSLVENVSLPLINVLVVRKYTPGEKPRDRWEMVTKWPITHVCF